MALVGEIFDAAMALMDELSAEGEARCERTEDYRHRTPAISNAIQNAVGVIIRELPMTAEKVYRGMQE